MSDVPQWCWWVALGLAVVLLVTLAVGAANSVSRRRSGDTADTADSPGPSPVRGWRRLGSPWWPAATFTLLVLFVLVLLAVPRVTGEYESKALVSLAPRDPVKTSADTLLLLGPRYLTLLDNPEVLRTAADDAGTTEKALRAGADASIEASTLIVDITFDSADPTAAARNAQALATALLDAVSQDELVKGRLIGSAVVPRSPANPTTDQGLVAGALASLAAAVVIGLAVRRRASA